MSSIEKLSILGIRSFSPEEQSVIEFFTPLTIIVGHNGAGKTTIIECLKYATTGDLPPNSKGGAFIHDLGLANESEIKAQIRLKFNSIRRQPMTIARSIQVTRKRAKLEQKTLESLLVTKDPTSGEQISMSSRVSDLDSEIPYQLGVSRAILENVIFCHQEESSWPLSEPSALKKKFDEIFSSTRYAKALDQLKSIRKEQMVEIKVQHSNLAASKVKLDVAKGIELERQLSVRKIEDCQRRMLEIDTEVELFQNKLDLCNIKKNEFERQKLEFDRMLKERDLNLSTIQELSGSIKIMQQSDEELQNLLLQRSSVVCDSESEWQRLKMERDILMRDISDCQRELAADVSQKEVLNVSIESARKKRAAFMHISKELGIELNAPLAEMDFDNDTVVLERLKSKLTEKFDALAKVKSTKATTENNFFLKLQALFSQKSQIQNELYAIKTTIAENEVEILDIDGNISQLNCTDIVDKLAKLKEQEATLERELHEAQSALDSSAYSTSKSSIENAIFAVESEIYNLNAKNKICNQTLQASTRVEFYATELAKKQQEYSDIVEIASKEFKTLFGNLPSPGDIAVEVGKNAVEIESKLQIFDQKYEELRYATKLLESKIEANRNSLAKKESELLDFEKRIAKVTGNEDFSICLEYQEQLLASLLQDSTNVFKYFSDEFHTKCSHCPLCERTFKGADEKQILLEKFKHSQQQEERSNERKIKIQQKLDELKNIRPIHDDAERYRLYEIPQLKASLNSLQEEQKQSQEILNDLWIQLTQLTEKDKLLKKITKSVENLPKIAVEIENYQTEISIMKNETTSLDVNGEESAGSINIKIESIDTLNAKLDEANARLASLRTQLDSLSADEIKKIKAISELKSCISTVKESIIQKQESLSLYQELQAKKLKLETYNANSKPKIDQLQIELDIQAQSIAKIDGEKLEALTVVSEQEQTIHNQLIICQSKLNEITAISTELAQNSTNYQLELARLDEIIAGKKQLLGQKSADIESLTERINRSSLELSEVESVERSIKDNLRLRDCRKKELVLAQQLESIKASLDSFKEQEIVASLRSQQLNISNHLGERSGLLGQIKVLQDQLTSFNAKLSGELVGVEQGYQADFVKFTTLSLTCSDLEKYIKALDAGIMKYHSMKMEEINKIIRELWQSTYQCGDIDTIEIRSDAESGTGNRSYNYRVVMVKGDRELDMRGRSSAGQRVLTCLIIRLALAEAFGLNCGILALDEPTTNLDRSNIESLAESLVGIIKNRRVQRNFQLVIITHDEEFVEMLGRSECVDWFWRIRKNSKNHSIIERQAYCTLS